MQIWRRRFVAFFIAFVLVSVVARLTVHGVLAQDEIIAAKDAELQANETELQALAAAKVRCVLHRVVSIVARLTLTW